MLSDLIHKIAEFAARFSFDSLLWFAWGSFLAAYALSLIITFALPASRAASKKPMLCLVNCYAVLTLELFLTVSSISLSLFAAGVFWLTGYLLYGLLCAISCALGRPSARVAATSAHVPEVSAPPEPLRRTLEEKPASSAAKNNVRLEHAIAVCEKLLDKNLGRTDRQQLEKLKTTLEVLKVKGGLTPEEGEILNDNFNALLKLMAKYNV